MTKARAALFQSINRITLLTEHGDVAYVGNSEAGELTSAIESYVDARMPTPITNVERYDCMTEWDSGVMEEDAKGDYVRWKDFVKLFDKLLEVEKDRDNWREECLTLREDAKKLPGVTAEVIQQMKGRSRFLWSRGRVKDPMLLDRAVGIIFTLQSLVTTQKDQLSWMSERLQKAEGKNHEKTHKGTLG